jgi:ubiquinone/menaquinone biosynthesis C-methylase UbiE
MSNVTSYTNRDARAYGLAEWFYPERALLSYAQVLLNPLVYALEGAVGGAQRRWRRERRRRLVGRSYDMALELARVLPQRSRVLDVGCGSGFIAHHLSALLGARVSGIDVRKSVDASIDYAAFDGLHFPADDNSFDAVLLCYVLHHAQDQPAFLREVRRVLRDGGLVVIYEDIPEAAWDAAVCHTHDRAWRARTGPCTFRLWEEWRRVFTASGFEVLSERRLSRWRNLMHPVRRGLYVLRASDSQRLPV